MNQFGQINSLHKQDFRPLNLTIAGVGPQLQDLFIKRQVDKWLFKTQLDLIDDEKRSNCIYLTGDATEEMSEIEPEFF